MQRQTTFRVSDLIALVGEDKVRYVRDLESAFVSLADREVLLVIVGRRVTKLVITAIDHGADRVNFHAKRQRVAQLRHSCRDLLWIIAGSTIGLPGCSALTDDLLTDLVGDC